MRDKRGFPVVDNEGRISINSVNSLSYDALLAWIKAVLHGEDPGAGGDRSELPHGFLKRVYRRLDPRIRQCFEDALLSHLGNLAANAESDWRGDAADELLLLTGSAFQGSPQQRAPVDHIRYIVEQKHFYSRTPPNLHLRAMQTLVALRHRAEPEFWRRQYLLGGDAYAMVILGGLALCGIAEAFNWLKEKVSEPAAFAALMRLLPKLAEEYPSEIAHYVEDLMPMLPTSLTTELGQLALRLGIPVPRDFRTAELKAEHEARAAEVRKRLKPNSMLEGRVSTLTDFGAFVDLGGGIEGLVHVSEISRKRVEHPKEVLKTGQTVKAMVLKVEKGGERISLSMKRLENDPWEGIGERYAPGETFTGKILRKAEFGLFVELEPGLEGLVHSSRLPWGMSLEDESLAPGETVEGWIHEVEPKRRRLSLSLRELGGSSPWHGVEDRIPVGGVVKGKVDRVTKFGAFIEIEPGLTGLLPFSTLRGGADRRQYYVGKEVSVRVLAIDREKRRISLGIESSKAEGSSVDYREYKQQLRATPMAATFQKKARKRTSP